MKRILILGESGFIGTSIGKRLEKEAGFEIFGTYNHTNTKLLSEDRQFKFDLTEMNQLLNKVKEIEPDYIVSCLRGDFEEQFKAHEALVKTLLGTKTKLIFISTANVFDADSSKGHLEHDERKADSPYGKFKIECENLVRNHLGERALIIRLPMVIGRECSRIKHLRVSVLNAREFLVYPNLRINTTTDLMVAEKIYYIIKNNLKGVFHFGTCDEMRHEAFFREIASSLGYSTRSFKVDERVTGYFSLKTVRALDFPVELTLTSNKVIEFAAGKNDSA